MLTDELGFPNAVREWFLERGFAHTVLCLEIAHRHGVTGTWVYEWELPIDRNIRRKGLQHAIIARRAENKRGRPKSYYIPDLEALQDTIRVWGIHGDDLPEWAYTSVKNYRAALHLALIERRMQRGDGMAQLSRAFMAKRLGVSFKTLRNYENEFGVMVMPCIRRTRLTWATVHKIPKRRSRSKRRWIAFRIDNVVTLAPFVRVAAIKALEQTDQVEVVERDCNFYAVPENWRSQPQRKRRFS